MPKDLLVALPVPGTVRGMTTGMLGHPCPGSVAGLQMGSNVSDEAWAVQDDLVMPINMGARHPLQSRVVFAIKSSRFRLSPETQLQEGARDGARQSPRDRQG